jgi:hypothetical protein
MHSTKRNEQKPIIVLISSSVLTRLPLNIIGEKISRFFM